METYAAAAREMGVPGVPQEGRLPGPDESRIQALASVRRPAQIGTVYRPFMKPQCLGVKV
jgi:hypothetical protein